MRASALAMALLLSPGTASANDGSFGGSGSVLIPLKETRVRMLSEDIVMELGAVWKVRAKYVFENATESDIDLQLGFPEEKCHPNDNCVGKGGEFSDLKTLVAGKDVTHRIGHAPKGHMLDGHYGRVFVYDARFPAKSKVTIEHSYSYDRSIGNGEEWASYVTETGKLWNGPIASARFTIRFPKKPWGFEIHPADFTVQLNDKELILEAKEWTPKRNLSVAMEWIPSTFAQHLGVEGDCLIPWSIDGKEVAGVPSTEALAKLSKAELRLCRAAVVAHRGGPVPEDLDSKVYPPPQGAKIRAVPNPAFDDALFSGNEKKYIAACDALLDPVPVAAPVPVPIPDKARSGCTGCSAPAKSGSATASWITSLCCLFWWRRRRRSLVR